MSTYMALLLAQQSRDYGQQCESVHCHTNRMWNVSTATSPTGLLAPDRHANLDRLPLKARRRLPVPPAVGHLDRPTLGLVRRHPNGRRSRDSISTVQISG